MSGSARFSRRTDWPAGSNRLAELVEKLRRDSVGFIDLTLSNPTQCGLGPGSSDISGASGTSAAQDRSWLDTLNDPANLRYSPDPKGLLTARQAVAAYYAAKGVLVDPEQIILTSGTSEAYQLVLRLLTSPGQSVMTPAPSYPLIDLLLDLNDIRQDRYQLTCALPDPALDAAKVRTSKCWSFDASNAGAARRSGTPALIAIHPNNPTGHMFGGDERKTLIEFVRANQMSLIVDEVFLDHGPDPDATFAGETNVLTFTLSGISKVLAMPQMKLSWIIVSGPDKDRVEALRRLEIMADVFLSVNTPAQNALPEWFKLAPRVHHDIRERVRTNLPALEQALAGPSAPVLLPGIASWTAILRLAPGTDDEAFAYDLLQKARVLVHPGYLFDFAGGAHLVLSLLLHPADFAEGVRRIAAYLSAPR